MGTARAAGDPRPVRPVVAAAAIAAGAGIVALAGRTFLSSDQMQLFLPMVAATTVFAIFTALLVRRVGSNLFGELGFVYLVLTLAYTLFPTGSFLILDLDLYQFKFSSLLPTVSDLSVHAWRHALFVGGVAAGYLAFRGSQVPGRHPSQEADGDGGTAAFLAVVIAACAMADKLLSAPVTEYVDFYTRFDHLSGILLRVAYISVALRTGVSFTLMALLFRNFSRRRWVTIVAVLAISTFELVYSRGSRINVLILLLGAACLFHLLVKPIRLRSTVVPLLVAATLFSAVEVVRYNNFDLSAAREAVSDSGGAPASEFSAVFFTGYHLYTERAGGSLPSAEWPMFLSELVALIPFVDHMRWNPMYWYAANYFPDAVVPPETIGPIAESAIWGGEIDLLLRSIVNGIFFAYLTRWYLRRQSRWWAVSVYAYCVATCAMTLKYSVFYQVVLLARNVIPALLLVEAFRRVARAMRASAIAPLGSEATHP